MPHINLAELQCVQALHVQHPNQVAVQALKQRECAVLTTLLSSSQGFVRDLAAQITSTPGNDKDMCSANLQIVI